MQINCAILFKPFNVIRLGSLLLLVSTASYGAEQSNMRGARYCEVILAAGLTNYAVYNSWGLNDCPAAQWDKISSAQVKKESGATFVHLNGPRYWVIDGFKNTTLINPSIKTFNGLSMSEAGVLHIKLTNLVRASSPYYKHQVKRQTTWIYEAGKPVYELINPNGEVFVMQSYSIQKSPQTQGSLTQLGAALKLPKGWIFKTGTLKKSAAILAINNLAIIVQDSFENTYQQAPHDLLNNEETPA